MMWDDQKRQRFQGLRQPNRQLSPAEQAELASLVQELEDAESAYLKPATDRLRDENDALKKRNRELANLIDRKKALMQHLQKTVDEAEVETRAIAKELASVLGSNPGSNMDD
jgi:chromosome segregation ATPase